MKIAKMKFRNVVAPLAAIGFAMSGVLLSMAAAQNAPPTFNGVINLDVRKSKPDWRPYIPKKAPEGAPNILFVLYDDTGLAAWSPYGGRINMPTLDKLAQNGLTYTQWHTAALCSPTRSTLLTGRNHHLERHGRDHGGLQRISGRAWPVSRRKPLRSRRSFKTMATALSGSAKITTSPEQDVAEGGDRKTWPLGQGFDRFYGFIGGETNQWYPDLVEDNHFIEPP